MKQQFIGLFHCKCGTSWRRDIDFFERTPDMVFSLEPTRSFILKSVDELEKSTKYSVTCNGTERVVYHTDSFDYVVVVDNEAYDLEISIHTPYEKLEIRPSSFLA